MTSARMSPVLRSSFDALLLDLDGTLYLGKDAIPGTADALGDHAQRLLYVTNNASRTPSDVAAHLRELGFSASDEDVVTSSQAAARVLQERVPAGSNVLVVGTDALAGEVERVGLNPVRSADDSPVAVVQGHSSQTGWPILAEACYAIRAGALWVASNTDTTLPTERGMAPGNGSMVAVLRSATGQAPIVAGKPAAPLMEDALARGGSRSPLVVGDRLDTDIEGANTVGVSSLLVLTGVSTAEDLLRAVPQRRPTFVALGLDALNAPIDTEEGEHWEVRRDGTDLVLTGGSGSDTEAGDALAALHAATVAAWAFPTFARLVPGDDAARRAVEAWADPAPEVGGRAVRLRTAVGGIG